jgi:hypothetical protein
MSYSKAKLKSSGDKASLCKRVFWIGKLSDEHLPIRTLLHISFKNTLIILTNILGTLKSMRILYNTSHLTKSYAFLKSMNS